MQTILSSLEAWVYVAPSSSFRVHFYAICITNIHFASSLVVTRFALKTTLLGSLIGLGDGNYWFQGVHGFELHNARGGVLKY